jgi:hypothetical protein
MKTRQELILDFMLALVGGGEDVLEFYPHFDDVSSLTPHIENVTAHQAIYVIAAAFADAYLEQQHERV